MKRQIRAIAARMSPCAASGARSRSWNSPTERTRNFSGRDPGCRRTRSRRIAGVAAGHVAPGTELQPGVGPVRIAAEPGDAGLERDEEPPVGVPLPEPPALQDPDDPEALPGDEDLLADDVGPAEEVLGEDVEDDGDPLGPLVLLRREEPTVEEPEGPDEQVVRAAGEGRTERRETRPVETRASPQRVGALALHLGERGDEEPAGPRS